MSYREALQALDAEWAAGDIDADVYAVERERIEYEYGEQQAQADEQREVAA